MYVIFILILIIRLFYFPSMFLMYSIFTLILAQFNIIFKSVLFFIFIILYINNGILYQF